MKIAIIGHTHGIGKELYNYYNISNEHTVSGYSRSNGFNIEHDQEKLIEEIKDTDLLIIVAHSGSAQEDLLVKLNKIVPNIIIFGSASTTYSHILYQKEKVCLEKTFDKLVTMVDSSNLLLLKPSFIENSKNVNRIVSDFTINSTEIISAIDFWLDNKNINKIEFKIQLTNKTITSLKSFGVNIEGLYNV